jgi:hypothetical protein
MAVISYEDYAAMSEQDRMRLAVSIASAVAAVQEAATGSGVEGGRENTAERWSGGFSGSGTVRQVKERPASAPSAEKPRNKPPGTTLRD